MCHRTPVKAHLLPIARTPLFHHSYSYSYYNGVHPVAVCANETRSQLPVCTAHDPNTLEQRRLAPTFEVACRCTMRDERNKYEC